MSNIILVIQIIISVLVVAAILLQSRGTGLGSLMGGSGGETYRSKRGAEKILFTVTIILAVLFFLSSLISVIV